MHKHFKAHILISVLLLIYGGSFVNNSPDEDVKEVCQQMNSKVRDYLDEIGVEFDTFHDISDGFGYIEDLGFYDSNNNRIYIAEDLPLDINTEVCLYGSLHAYLHHENIIVTDKKKLAIGFIGHLNDNNHEPWALGNLYSQIEGKMKTFYLDQTSRLKTSTKDEEIALFYFSFKSRFLLELRSDYKDLVKLGPYQSLSPSSYLSIKESTDNIERYFNELIDLASKINQKPSNFIIYLERLKLHATTLISKYYYNTNFINVSIKVILKHKSGATLTANERGIYESISFANSDFKSIFF